MPNIPTICCAGEAMAELAPAGRPGLYRRSVAGDTFNTAVYLARLGCNVHYLTRLGDDPCSRDILCQLRAEGIGDGLVRQVPGRRAGLYMIDNDDSGERHFTYWREHSPGRETFSEVPALGKVDAFYFSGITLAVCRSGLDNLLQLLKNLRDDGSRIVFDPNYRPTLWDDQGQAGDYCRAVLPFCDTVLPTLNDDTQLWGIDCVTGCVELYRHFGAREVVVKAPDLRIHCFSSGESLVIEGTPTDAVDTTGAGDAFNAAYLAARLQGWEPDRAIGAGQVLAARVVRHRGAIIAREHMEP